MSWDTLFARKLTRGIQFSRTWSWSLFCFVTSSRALRPALKEKGSALPAQIELICALGKKQKVWTDQSQHLPSAISGTSKEDLEAWLHGLRFLVADQGGEVAKAPQAHEFPKQRSDNPIRSRLEVAIIWMAYGRVYRRNVCSMRRRTLSKSFGLGLSSFLLRRCKQNQWKLAFGLDDAEHTAR